MGATCRKLCVCGILRRHGANEKGLRAECIDCHLPPKDRYFSYMTAKALAGGKDLIKHFFGGDYAYDSLAITLKHKLAANQHVSIGYQMINFNNHNGGSFDDYTANGALLTYTCTF